ncbi:MAG TPA: sugar ABC transporter permease [Limnochordia bacterium]|jgi:arabinogalactan oligomer/maltooligosaccharide transport system permease protein|nr:sugar ABC transporter permease [Bacillota bacterium]HOB09901.1 sugar ABC transporter permease [Limnochordia bacterium]HPZ31849.1 sugar ABC transporter permease [Limnochordia bacterium]
MEPRVRARINAVIILVFLTLTSIFVLYPIVYIIAAAFSPGTSIASLNIVPFGDGVTLEHFRHLFQNTNYVIWFKNTLIIALATSISTVIIASLGAYVFSRFRFTLKKSLMTALLILQIFPSFVGMVAIYVILLRIDGHDELWGLVLVYLAGNIPYNTWLVKSYIDTIPRSLDEAAIIDGASHFKTWLMIIMPVARPILTFLAIASFTGPWMDFIFPKLVLRSAHKQTLALGLFSFITDKKNEFTNFAAGSLLVAIPFIIFFVAFQRHLITSLGAGTVKE